MCERCTSRISSTVSLRDLWDSNFAIHVVDSCRVLPTSLARVDWLSASLRDPESAISLSLILCLGATGGHVLGLSLVTPTSVLSVSLADRYSKHAHAACCCCKQHKGGPGKQTAYDPVQREAKLAVLPCYVLPCHRATTHHTISQVRRPHWMPRVREPALPRQWGLQWGLLTWTMTPFVRGRRKPC
jgi:hypothetical protein